jgi:RNA polymerase sigma factor (TIGR02999 family)
MSSEITNLLRRVHDGDRDALDTLTPLVYQELHRIAVSQLRRDRFRHTLQPTALIHEAFLRIFGDPPPLFQDRAHFLGIAARIMRQVLVDYARARKAKKRAGALQIAIQDEPGTAAPPLADILAIDQSLDRLASEDPALVQLIEMRFFAGMTAEETAEALGQSVHVVRHNLRYGLARLRQQIEPNLTDS